MPKVSLNTIGSRYGSIDALNDNFDAIEAAIENTLSLDGTSPNAMTAALDLNSNDLLNVGTTNTQTLYINGIEVEPSTGVTAGSAFQTYSFTATAGQTTFSVAPATPLVSSLLVSVNGLELPPADVTVSTTNVVIPACTLGDEVVVRRFTKEPTVYPTAATQDFQQAGTGAQIRTVQSKLREWVTPEDFGAVGDNVTDDSAAIQAAINSGKNVYFVANAYRVGTKLVFNQVGCTYFALNSALVFNGTNSTRLADVTANRVTFDGIHFNGGSKQPRTGLVYVAANVDRPKFLNCRFQDITCTAYGTNQLNQTYALLINPYAVTNFEIAGCLFKDLIKYNDNATNVPPAQIEGIGFIGGICFLPEDVSEPTAAQPTPTAGRVHGCTFENIQTILASGLSIANQATFNDADAIRTYGYTGGGEQLNVHVADCVFRNISKRAVKFRAAGSVMHDCEVYADGMQYGMIVPIDVTSNTKVHNVKVYASASKPVQSGVQWSIGPDAANRETLIQGLYVSHCITGVGFFSDATNQPLRNLVLRDIFINQASVYGIGQGSPLPSTMENIVMENLQIFGSGNNCAAINIVGANDVTSGVKIKNVYIRNGSFKVAGVNNDIQDVQLEIDSSSYAGFSAGEYLFRVGDNGYGGYQHVENLFINAWNLNTGYLSASRTVLGILIGDNAYWKNVRVKVPNGLSQSYAHCELWGNDWNLDGYTYDGPGYTFVGTSVASVRWGMKNCVRLGSGASSSEFIYTSNAGTGNGLMENITDFRPTTQPTITINNGLGVGSRFIVTNVASKTSNVTIVQNGGLATVTNAIKFP